MIVEINALGDMPNAEKAALLSSLTGNPIDLQALENLLGDEGLAWRDEITGNWSGPIPALVELGGELGEGVAELLRHLNKIRSVHIESDKPEWALKCSSLLAGLVIAGVITQEQSDKVIALGGGLRHGVISEQDIADAIAEEDARVAQEAVDAANYEAHMQQIEKWTEAYNANIAPLMDSVEADPMVWAQAVQAIANNWSV
tara:strand:+ start:4278 stop:4880 length:603 start_codon:yes stop_codon:yes gene_type:complete